MNFWNNLITLIKQHGEAALLYVLESSGSSPGRQGFKLAVSRDGEMEGTIGGGIMEQKLVELARSRLSEGGFDPFIKQQIHKPEAGKDRSGMICDGEQTVAFYHLNKHDLPVLEELISSENAAVKLTHEGLAVTEVNGNQQKINLEELSDSRWQIMEQPGVRPTAYIFGGGHVGLAMSRMMAGLNFRVVVLDDRRGLNTMQHNRWADEKRVIDYREADQHVEEGAHSFVIIMSFGYRTDEIIIRRLLDRNFRYIGMMGSRNKVDTLWNTLRQDGYSEDQLRKVHAPIGLPIKSETTDEIAVSIAAEIIRVKNQGG